MLRSLSVRTRIVFVVVVLIIFIHASLSYTSTSYNSMTSIPNLVQSVRGKHWRVDTVPEQYYLGELQDPWLKEPRANATLVMLARNKDVTGAVESIRHLEDRFNHRRRYPWVFLNDEPFDENFKMRVQLMTKSVVTFGTIPKEQWRQPAWINETRAEEGRKKLKDYGFVPYADSVPYRNMCRYNSGYFFRHPLLRPYKWYWRVEPNIDYTCDIQFDPFNYMQEHKKTYGFTISMNEYVETIPTLWDHVKEFIRLHPQYVAKDNAMKFISDDGGDSFNKCHFWSNFEIADLDFWRSPAYTAFFEYLDSKGGFYYERWGDAPVHSLAAALFLPRDQIHFFAPIGYEHAPHNHCPTKSSGFEENHCQCGPEHSFDERPDSCLGKFMETVGALDMGKGW